MKTTDDVLDLIKSLSEKLTSIDKRLAAIEEDVHHIFNKVRGLDLLVNDVHRRVKVLEEDPGA